MAERAVSWCGHLAAIEREGITTRAYAAREELSVGALDQWRRDAGADQSPECRAVGERARGLELRHPGSWIGAVYLCRPAIDRRKSIEGLSALVERGLGLNPFGDGLCVFINRPRDKLKALYWQRNGFSLRYKRLEATPADKR